MDRQYLSGRYGDHSNEPMFQGSLMLKGNFWLMVIFALVGFHTHLLALFLFVAIVGFVATKFFAPSSVGPSGISDDLQPLLAQLM
jgi:hypothetical protein